MGRIVLGRSVEWWGETIFQSLKWSMVVAFGLTVYGYQTDAPWLQRDETRAFFGELELPFSMLSIGDLESVQKREERRLAAIEKRIAELRKQ